MTLEERIDKKLLEQDKNLEQWKNETREQLSDGVIEVSRYVRQELQKVMESQEKLIKSQEKVLAINEAMQSKVTKLEISIHGDGTKQNKGMSEYLAETMEKQQENSMFKKNIIAYVSGFAAAITLAYELIKHGFTLLNK